MPVGGMQPERPVRDPAADRLTGIGSAGFLGQGGRPERDGAASGRGVLDDGRHLSQPVHSAAVATATPEFDGEPGDAGISALLVTSTASSSTVSTEAAAPLAEFRASLFQLVKGDKPESAEEAPTRRLMQLYTRVLTPWLSDDRMTYDELVAKYVGLWSVLERPDAQRFAVQALLGIQLISAGRFTTASKIYSEIEFQTSTPAALSYVMRGVGYFLRSMILLAGFAVYTAFLIKSVIRSVNVTESGAAKVVVAAKTGMFDGFLSSTTWHVVIASAAGMLGSVVSILLRLTEFETTKGRSQMFLTLTGATLPVVGGMFGAFVAALLSSNVVNLNLGAASAAGMNIWLFLVVGFLSGFSERFSRGFLKIAEDRLGAGGQADQKVNVTSQAVVSIPKPEG